MEHSDKTHFDFMRLAITNQNSIRKPQIVFASPKSLAIATPGKDASRIAVFKNLGNVCLCEEGYVPIVTLGSFSDGFSDGFDI